MAEAISGFHGIGSRDIGNRGAQKKPPGVSRFAEGLPLLVAVQRM